MEFFEKKQYPTMEEKQQLAQITGISLSKVQIFFKNARYNNSEAGFLNRIRLQERNF